MPNLATALHINNWQKWSYKITGRHEHCLVGQLVQALASANNSWQLWELSRGLLKQRIWQGLMPLWLSSIAWITTLRNFKSGTACAGNTPVFLSFRDLKYFGFTEETYWHGWVVVVSCANLLCKTHKVHRKKNVVQSVLHFSFVCGGQYTFLNYLCII